MTNLNFNYNLIEKLNDYSTFINRNSPYRKSKIPLIPTIIISSIVGMLLGLANKYPPLPSFVLAETITETAAVLLYIRSKLGANVEADRKCAEIYYEFLKDLECQLQDCGIEINIRDILKNKSIIINYTTQSATAIISTQDEKYYLEQHEINKDEKAAYIVNLYDEEQYQKKKKASISLMLSNY